MVQTVAAMLFEVIRKLFGDSVVIEMFKNCLVIRFVIHLSHVQFVLVSVFDNIKNVTFVA